MNYLSVCSGIEAATEAWHPLRWKPVAFAEIEKFASAVLAHRHPLVPNLGDMTNFKSWPNYENESAVNLLVGGTPCQSFSVAGLRKGLDDPRGNLTLGFLALAGKYRPGWVVWENVPGVLSDRTNAFGHFLAGLGELGYGWAYRVLDAQYFGVAQRRRRVFVVGCLGGWQRAAAVLFEPESLRGDPPPSRETGEGIAGNVAKSLAASDGGIDREDRHTLIGASTSGQGFRREGIGPLRAREQDSHENIVADTVRSHPRPGSNSTGLVIPIQKIGKRQSGTPMNGVGHGKNGDPMFTLQRGAIHGVAHSLRADGFDASEDGTGRGTPLVPCVSPALKARDYKGPSSDGDGDGDGSPLIPVVFQSKQSSTSRSPSFDQVSPTLDAAKAGGVAVAFGSKDRGADALIDCSPTLRSGNHHGSHADAGVPPAICFDTTQITSKTNRSNPRENDPCHPISASAHPPAVTTLEIRGRDGECNLETRSDGTANALRSSNGGRAGMGVGAIHSGMSVRRLTPRECERLQGFPDDYTMIPWRGKPAEKCPDGPRYRALGNSMAVPVMRWIGRRIAMLEAKP